MTDKDYSPLSATCVRVLNDKMYEKRKTAAIEIDKMVKDFVAEKKYEQIKKILVVLGKNFIGSQNPHSRKGGLIGLAATALGLGKETGPYVEDLVLPILECFTDQDSRVRYYACEALYNVVKISRGSVLPLFNDIFDALSKLVADPDQNVKNACELLDRLLKDIVTESASFDLVAFMPLIRERIYAKNPFGRQFIVSWISVLDAVPDIDMLIFLPEILDGLLCILEGPTMEVRKSCEAVLGEFLHNIIENPSKVDYRAMVNILITHSVSSDEFVQHTALVWIKEFITLAGRTMLPFASGILSAVLPSVAYDESKKLIHETAKSVNYSLMQLVNTEDDHDSPEASEQKESSSEIELIEGNDCYVKLDLPNVVEILTIHLMHTSMQTKVAALRWIYHLHIKIPNKIFRHVEEIFPVLLKTLSDPSDEVVLLDLEVLAEISSSSAGLKYQCKMDIIIPELAQQLVHRSSNMNSYFTKFMVSLLNMFSTDGQLLEDRGSFIIRQLCLLLNSEDIYRTLSEILLHEEDLRFARHMVQTLNTILLTSTELFELRNQLKDLLTDESCSLFCCLYRTWCHSPVSLMSLCLLTQNYSHACDLLHHFADLEVTVEFLTEIDKLVQLIDSPIFTYLRLQLLDAHQNPHLVKSLYGLLMLLPQSEAFHTLRRRLNCVPNLQVMPQDSKSLTRASRPCLNSINFRELLSHFQVVQEKHRNASRMLRCHYALEKT